MRRRGHGCGIFTAEDGNSALDFVVISASLGIAADQRPSIVERREHFLDEAKAFFPRRMGCEMSPQAAERARLLTEDIR
jgi:4-aminobutyrate aminotransferase-like enzyme